MGKHHEVSTVNAAEYLKQKLLLESLDFDFVPPCESEWCQQKYQKGLHDAEWFVRIDPCGHILAWCNHRFMDYSRAFLFGVMITCQVCAIDPATITWWQSIKRAPKNPLR